MTTAPLLTSAASGPTPEGPLVLVVDDDDDTRFLYAESLEPLGYRIAGEPDARRGIETALRIRPDAIVMDVAMPGMNGIEAIRELKADPRMSHCLFVLVTGSGMKWFDEACAVGCDAYLAKPFNPAALVHLLQLPSSRETRAQPLPPEVVKRCSCGREFTRGQWNALPRCGRMHLARRNTVVDLRNCGCGSSMALALDGETGLGGGAANGEESARIVPLQKIFVVDRDVQVQRLVLHFIGSDYRVEFFDDGYTALDRVRSSRPAAVVAEIMTPRLDGLALCKLLKGDSATSRVPVVLFSVLSSEERARQAGADAFLQKPLEKGSFVGRLVGLVEQEERGES